MKQYPVMRDRIIAVAAERMAEHLARTVYSGGNDVLPIREVRREVAHEISGQYGGELLRLVPIDELPSKYLNSIIEKAAFQMKYERRIIDGRECWVRKR